MEYHLKTIEDVAINGRKVILRVDFNVPLDSKKKVLNDYRIQQSLPTIKFLLKHHAKIILLSH